MTPLSSRAFFIIKMPVLMRSQVSTKERLSRVASVLRFYRSLRPWVFSYPPKCLSCLLHLSQSRINQQCQGRYQIACTQNEQAGSDTDPFDEVATENDADNPGAKSH